MLRGEIFLPLPLPLWQGGVSEAGGPDDGVL